MCKDFEKLLAYHCAPSIFGIKSANLVNIDIDKCKNIEEDILKINMIDTKVKFRILKKCGNKVLLLTYKEKNLYHQLFEANNYNYLLTYGYPKEKNLDLFLEYLSKRIKLNDFPHEIGVFLGYDLNDIKDYVSGKKECLLTGYWKVYSNPDLKLECFNRFSRCRRAALTLLERGYDFERVII